MPEAIEAYYSKAFRRKPVTATIRAIDPHWLGGLIVKTRWYHEHTALVLARRQCFVYYVRSTTRMLPNRYDFRETEPRLARLWAEADIYTFDSTGTAPLFTIDTPPATVSGQLHIGHC